MPATAPGALDRPPGLELSVSPREAPPQEMMLVTGTVSKQVKEIYQKTITEKMREAALHEFWQCACCGTRFPIGTARVLCHRCGHHCCVLCTYYLTASIYSIYFIYLIRCCYSCYSPHGPPKFAFERWNGTVPEGT